MKNITKNCAIYCRKSTEEGLDMDFNTLDAQREACDAYITSQRAEGWQVEQTQYNDGGFSGGNMERPALKRLLEDIKEGKIQTVVVYKIDRLTRSLMDFAKLVDVFDEHGVTFVSVTQSFNTTTSMGRLTLNVLLSFAQFEREVSAERIRDKFAASKKKGMWMGGAVPIGYFVEDRKLHIKADEAKTVTNIFKKYLELGCVRHLKEHLDQNGIITKERISKKGNKSGGVSYSRGRLYSILRNPVYTGKIKHKDKIYEGLHDRIIDEDLWNAVQEKLTSNAHHNIKRTRSRDAHLLKGLLFDKDGNPYRPVHTQKKKSRRYRYYENPMLREDHEHPDKLIARLPAGEIEKAVTDTITDHLSSANLIGQMLGMDEIIDHTTLGYISRNINDAIITDIITACLYKVTVTRESVSVEFNIPALVKKLENDLRIALDVNTETDAFEISAPFKTKKSFGGTIIIEPENAEKDPIDLPPQQLKNLVRGFIWRDEHFAGMSMRAIARRENMSEAGIRKIIMGSFDTLMNL